MLKALTDRHFQAFPDSLPPHLRPRKRSAILALQSQHPLCDNRKIPFAQPWSQARDIVLFGV